MQSARFTISADTSEVVIVSSILAFSAYFGGGRPADWLTAAAIVATFATTQLAFNLAERTSAEDAESGRPENLARRYRRLYITKEILWIASCIALRNYPLIASTAVFSTYPFWRKALRESVLQSAHENSDHRHGRRRRILRRAFGARGAGRDLRRARRALPDAA